MKTKLKTNPTTGRAFEMPNPLAQRIKLGLTPTSSREWVEKEEPLAILRREFGAWITSISDNEKLFKKHIYDVEQIDEFDLRQHRGRICGLISTGEWLAMGFSALAEQAQDNKELLSSLGVIDQNLNNLFAALLKWHAPLMVEGEIPNDLKQSIQELEEGKVVDLDI